MEEDEMPTQKFPRNHISNGKMEFTIGGPNGRDEHEEERDEEVKRGGGGGSGGGGGGGRGRGNTGQVEIGNDGGGLSKLYNWPSSRIFRVSRASGGKDRHSKVWTSKGLRDRRVRLSVPTAIQFYDLQDRLGYDQPSKAVEWLLTAAATSIAELPSITTSFPETPQQLNDVAKRPITAHNDQGLDLAEIEMDDDEDDNLLLQRQQESNGLRNSSKSACSSTSETSKGSGLSFSRPESRIKARERARERAAGKEKEKEIEGSGVRSGQRRHQNLNPISPNSSFTELLTGGMHNNNHCPSGNSNAVESNIFQKSPREWIPSTSMDYFTNLLSPSTIRPINPTNFLGQIQQQPVSSPLMFSVTGDQNPHFSFLTDHLVPIVVRGGGHGGSNSNNNNSDYNLNFSVSTSPSTGIAGFSRGTLQSNSSSSPSMLPHIQRFPTIDGPSAFFISPTTTPVTNASSATQQHFLSGFDPQLQLYYDNNSSRQHHDHKGKGKNSTS